MLPASTDEPIFSLFKTSGTGTVPVSTRGLIDFQVQVAVPPVYSQAQLWVTRMVTVLLVLEISVTVPRKLYDGSMAPAGREQAQMTMIRKDNDRSVDIHENFSTGMIRFKCRTIHERVYKYSPIAGVLTEPEKIRLMVLPDGTRLLTEMTKKQRDILTALGLCA